MRLYWFHMRSKGTLATWLVPAMVAAGGIAAVTAWLQWRPSIVVAPRVAGTDRPPQAASATSQSFQGKLIPAQGAKLDESLAGAWPCFRGADRDNVNRDENVFLAKKWPPAGPAPLWNIEAGEGYAGPAILNGRVYLTDYDQVRRADAVRCLSLADGKELWRYTYPVPVKRFHGMSRTTPAVTDKFVVSIGPKCHVTCLDAKSGELLWKIDLVDQYGSIVPPWYTGQCPLIDNGLAILAPGGPDVLMMAVDCATGAVKWEAPNPQGWKMTHSSVTPLEVGGRRMYLYCADKGIAALWADDGTVAFTSTEWRIKIANIPTPVAVGEGKIFLAGGYNAGCMMMQIEEKDGRVSARKLWTKPAETFGATQQTPIFYEGYIYAIRPDGELACMDKAGNLLWNSGPANRFGLGPLLISQGLIYALDDNGTLTMARAVPTAYEQLARAKVLQGHDCWGPLALASGRLIARDLTRIVCLQVAE